MSVPGRDMEKEFLPATADDKPAQAGMGSDSDSISDPEKNISDPIKKSTTRSTRRSGASEPESSAPDDQVNRRKKWYRNLNPLRWGRTPPVPTERSISREYGASIFSIITFQWMAPMMDVSLRLFFSQLTIPLGCGNTGSFCRLAIGDPSSSTTYGW